MECIINYNVEQYTHTFSPLELKTSGNSVVLKMCCKSVVLPALDLPMTRILKRKMQLKCFLVITGSMQGILPIESCGTFLATLVQNPVSTVLVQALWSTGSVWSAVLVPRVFNHYYHVHDIEPKLTHVGTWARPELLRGLKSHGDRKKVACWVEVGGG